MSKKQIEALFSGFEQFKEKYISQDPHYFDRLAKGQAPQSLVIACSDSRVDPALMINADPGEIFVVRNVANLVPPYETSPGFHGVSAAIEFAVNVLLVKNIIILGHRQCGGIRSLVRGDSQDVGTFVHQWMKIAKPAREKVMNTVHPHDEETLCRACEKESIVCSLSNLRTFPFIEKAIRMNSLKLIGAYFDIDNSELLVYDIFNDQFVNYKEIELI